MASLRYDDLKWTCVVYLGAILKALIIVENCLSVPPVAGKVLK